MRCDGLNIIFDLVFFFSCIHILTHSTLHHSDGPLWYLVFRARVLFLKYNFYQISFFSPLFIPFGVWSLSIFFHPPIWKSPVTKHWPFSLLRNYTYACKGSALSCMCAFHVILPYGHAEPLIMFLLRAHFLLISSLNSPAKRINELKQLKKGQILMVYIYGFFHVSCVGFSIKKTCLIVWTLFNVGHSVRSWKIVKNAPQKITQIWLMIN